MQDLIAKAESLLEALPYILNYDQKTIVVKYGGNAMTGTGAHDFSQDIVLMKQTGIDPVVAFRQVSAARGFQVPETQEQRDWVIELAHDVGELTKA